MMIKRIPLLAAAFLLITAPASADYVIKDGNGTLRTVKAGTACGSDVICTQTSLLDGAGAFIGTVANPFAITFGTGVTLPAFASTPTFNLGNINGAAPSADNPLWIQPGTAAVFHVICDSGCSGGGGGGGTSSLFDAAFPASGTAIGLSDGTDMVSWRGDVTNGGWVNIKASVPLAVTGTFWQAVQPVSGTVAATQSGAWNIGSVTTLPAITGTVTANAGTNLNTSALALESGGNLATAATGIGTINTNIGSPGATVCATDTGSCNLNALLQRNNSRISSMITALGSPFQAGGSIGNTAFGISGTLPAFAATPTFNLGTLNGAATAAAQSTGNASLSSIDGKTPALGQALASASVPVILPAATITTLTPPTTVTANLGTLNGAATASNQTSGAQKTQIVDGSGNVIASTSNNLNVQCANCSGSGVSTADGASFTAGASLFAGAGGVYQTSATSNPLSNGQQGLFQVTSNRALFTNLRNTAGAEIGTASIPIRTDPTGSTTQPVSGTVTANLGTLNGAATAANQILTHGPVAPGTATATKTDILGMQYNSTQATFTNGQQGAVQGTARGALYVATGADAFAVNATLGAETTKVIGTTRTLGNSGAVVDFAGQNATSPANSWLIGGQFNTTPTTLTSGNSSPLQLDNAGNLLVNIKAGASSGAVAQGSTTSGQTGGLGQAATTTAAPTYADGTTNPLSTDTSGNLRVSVSSAVGLAQGSTTSGQTGSMIMGAVTTSAPTYTTAQTSPISLDTSGNVRMTCSNCSGSGASGTDEGTFTAGSSTFAPGGGFFQTTATSNALTNGQWGAWQMTANRAGFINLRNASGTEVGTSSAEVFVGGRGTAGSAAGGVLSVQGVASMTPILANPGTAANWGVVTQGSTTSGQSGQLTMGAVTTAAPSYTNAQSSPLNLTTSGSLRTDTSSVGGNTVLTGNGSTGTGSQRVTIASDSSARAVAGEGATGSAAPSGAQQMGMRSGANMVAATQANASVAISGNSAATTQLVALSASAVIHVTSFDFMAAGTANVTLVYGTGTNCGTGTTALTGAYPLTAQAGIAKGSGQGPVLVVPAGNALCWTNSAGVQVSGSLSYTQFVP